MCNKPPSERHYTGYVMPVCINWPISFVSTYYLFLSLRMNSGSHLDYICKTCSDTVFIKVEGMICSLKNSPSDSLKLCLLSRIFEAGVVLV